MRINVNETVNPKKSMATPSTLSIQQKRGLTSPEWPLDLKKNKVYLSPGSDPVELLESDMSEEGATSMEGVSMAGDKPKVNITLRECENDIQRWIARGTDKGSGSGSG